MSATWWPASSVRRPSRTIGLDTSQLSNSLCSFIFYMYDICLLLKWHWSVSECTYVCVCVCVYRKSVPVLKHGDSYEMWSLSVPVEHQMVSTLILTQVVLDLNVNGALHCCGTCFDVIVNIYMRNAMPTSTTCWERMRIELIFPYTLCYHIRHIFVSWRCFC